MKISKYTNQNTPLSIAIISPIIEAANQLTIKDIEKMQVKHGISDQLLGDIMGVNKSQVSRMKKGESHLALQGKIALYFMFQTLEFTF
jgi:predicted XRE-type DNA-binding protein